MPGWDLISLTTDYGTSDVFVGVCHGVIAGIAPAVRIVDLTHAVPPGDVTRAAVALADAVPYLPPAVHVAVVDPGVGTDRRAVAVAAGGHVLVGPDNGLLGWAAAALGGPDTAVVLTNPALHRHPVSRTFHGRDVFAPVAAHLARGVPLHEAGDRVPTATLVLLPDPLCSVEVGRIAAEVLAIDHFGNLQLALGPLDLAAAGPAFLPGTPWAGGAATASGAADRSDDAAARLRVGSHDAVAGGTFADTEPGGLVLLVDSADRVALAVRGGSAAQLLGVVPGDTLTVTADRPSTVEDGDRARG